MTENTQTIIWTTGIWTNGKKAALAVIIAIWFAAAAFIGAEHLLPNTGADLFAPIAVTAVIPVMAFIGLYLISTGFRRFVLAQDIETLTMLQHWRVIGFAFLPLCACAATRLTPPPPVWCATNISGCWTSPSLS
jgi:hypothetical protein